MKASDAYPGVAPAVRMSGIGKSFGGIRAVNNVDLIVARGEIHALLGENGAGKSTILKILRGALTPDAGLIEIDGKLIDSNSPDAGRRGGVAMIFQEMSLIPTLTVAQNIFLNHEHRGAFGLIDDRIAIREAARLFHTLSVDVDPKALAGNISTGQRQLTEIVKAMSQSPRILVLDEPTSALSASEVEHLFALLRRLKADGVAIIYVSHRMDEIMRIADRATILRDGRHIVSAPMAELTLESIVAHIVGRRVANLADMRGHDVLSGEVFLELDRVSGVTKPRDVSLTVRKGEVVGVAGLLGSGRSSLARLICGLDSLVSGEIRVRGKSVHLANAHDALAKGLALIPEDRIRQGLVTEHSVASNICLPILDRISTRSWVSNARAEAVADGQVARLRIKTPSRDSAVKTLSGGNQQKVVLGKWLAADPDILVLDEPTAGIDIGSKAEIVALIRELARGGKAIVLISSELIELLTASDRIVMMADGQITREIATRELAPTVGFGDAEHRLQVMLQRAH